MENDCGCPTLNKEDWDLKKHNWDKRAFYKTKHFLLFHVPLNIGKAIRKGTTEIKEIGYTLKQPYMMLDEETGFFSANILIAIEEIPKDDPNVEIWEPATLYSKYYHGPFKGLKKEIVELMDFVEKKEKEKPVKLYTWVTNCPECWEKQGGPTTIIFAKIC